MAALWLQSVSLLVLLIVSWPSSQAAPPKQFLCGAHLVDALHLVCGDRSFFYNPKRSVDPLLGDAAAGGENKAAEFASSGRLKRNVVEQCCLKPCSISDLENYCN